MSHLHDLSRAVAHAAAHALDRLRALRHTMTTLPRRRCPATSGAPLQRALHATRGIGSAPLVLLVLGATFGLPGQAAALCWIDAPTRVSADQLPAGDARLALMNRVAQRVHALVKGNADLQSLTDTRVRSRWQIGGPGGPARTLWYQARDHRASMWVGDCGVLEGADRLPARASVVVEVNGTSNLFNGPPLVSDEGLVAWAEPTVARHVQGRPLYFGWKLVLTKTGQPPWVPVTQAEFLDFAAREMARQAAATGDNPWLRQQREALQRYRASLDARALAAQARNGWVWQHPDVPAERWPKLVKLDPAFPWDANPQRAQIVSLTIQGADAQAAAMERALHSIDLAGFEALFELR